MDSEGGGAKEPEDKTKEPRKKVAWIGGAADRWTEVVYRVYKRYIEELGEENFVYFEHWERKKLAKWIQENQDDHVTVIGHSWGGRTAAHVVAKGNHVDVLITVDPVSWRRPSFPKVAESSGIWVNFDSVSTDRSWADIVAWFGRRWNDAPKPFADEFKTRTWDHEQICDVHCVPDWNGKGKSQ